MRFRELFDENMFPIWDKIYALDCFNVMKKTRQSAEWHKEGNVANHTERVVNEMKRILEGRECDVNSEDYLVLMSAALCHDLGKPSTTRFDQEKQDYSCKGHGFAGEKIVRKLFFEDDFWLREKVCWLVRNHMAPFYLKNENGEYDADKIKRLSIGPVTLDFLLTLNWADALGSINDHETSTDVLKRLNSTCVFAMNNCDNCIEKPYNYKRCEKLNLYSGLPEVIEQSTPEFTVYIMIGLPGAGKDIWIQNHIPNVPMLCRDVIRTEIGIEGEKPFGTEEQENEVTRILAERLIDCCRNKRTCVVNNTNIMKMRRNEIRSLIMPYNPKIVYVYVEAPTVKDCKERRAGQISPKVIKRMLNSFEMPESWEYDELIVHKQKS